MGINRKNILEALLWLKKQNPFYADVSIKEENLDWMQGEEEVSIATNALELKTKNSKQYKIITGKSDYVSPAHNTGLEEQQNITDNNKYNPKTTKEHEVNDCTDLDISTMHANQSDPLPTTSPVTIEKDPANRFPTGSQQVPNRLRTSSVFFEVGTVEKFSCNFP